MSGLISYSCAKCGAVLSVDKLQGQMACPFCGTEFDYIDFHREELILQGGECLSRGSYEPAREKFNKILESNPSDVEAYRGLILCAQKLRSTKDLVGRYDQIWNDLDAVESIVRTAKKHVTEEDFVYLQNLSDLFEIPTIYCKYKDRESDTVGLERKRRFQLKEKREREGFLKPVTVIVIALLLVLFVFSVAIVLVYGLKMIKYLFFPILPFEAVIVLLYIIYRNRVIEKTNVVNISASSKVLSGKRKEIKEKYSEILSEVLKYEEGFVKKPEKKVIKREEKKLTPKPGPYKSGDVICAKCGGRLTLNTEQELYECISCGVSYGKYLFFGDLTANAVKAMEMGEFDEADQILSHKLSMDPKDFEALFGRFLCAGRWKSQEDIDIDDKLLMAHVRKLPYKLDAIEKRIINDIPPFWEDIRKYADLLGEYAVKMHSFNKVRERYMSLCVKLRKSKFTSEEKENFTKQKNDVMEKLNALDGELKDISSRIDEAVKVLKEADSDCVFF